MYAVIFTATAADLDTGYSTMADKLRTLALQQFGCSEFISATEGDREIAISYWDSLEQIKAWKQDPLHLQAQQQGRDHWYRNYRVQVVKIERQYSQGD